MAEKRLIWKREGSGALRWRIMDMGIVRGANSEDTGESIAELRCAIAGLRID